MESGVVAAISLFILFFFFCGSTEKRDGDAQSSSPPACPSARTDASRIRCEGGRQQTNAHRRCLAAPVGIAAVRPHAHGPQCQRQHQQCGPSQIPQESTPIGQGRNVQPVRLDCLLKRQRRGQVIDNLPQRNVGDGRTEGHQAQPGSHPKCAPLARPEQRPQRNCWNQLDGRANHSHDGTLRE